MVPKYTQILRRAREALRAQASKSTEAIVLVTDSDGLTLWVNGTFHDVMGYAMEEVAGRMPCHVLHGAATELDAAAAIECAILERKPFETRIVHYRKNGSPVLLDLEILPLFDEAAQLHGFVYLGQIAGSGEASSRADSAREHNPFPQPVQTAPAAAGSAGRSNGAEGTANYLFSAYPYKVLVAEDHPINLKLVVALLQAAGCEARCAVNGEQALAELESADFDLIVMDSQMPVMTGIEAIAIIRMREDWKRCIPILSLTAHAMKGAEEYHTSAGADLYMSKPLRSDCFIGAVRSLAQRGRDLREKEGEDSAESLPPR